MFFGQSISQSLPVKQDYTGSTVREITNMLEEMGLFIQKVDAEPNIDFGALGC